jgi:hypothetical protein
MIEINTHGIRPDPQRRFKLFDVDGFQLNVSLSGNDNDDGYGIRYTVPVDIPGLAPVSIWMGVVNGEDDVSDEACAVWDDIFNEMDDEGARKALKVFFDETGPTLASFAAKSEPE